jgi:hypothetical protein
MPEPAVAIDKKHDVLRSGMKIASNVYTSQFLKPWTLREETRCTRGNISSYITFLFMMTENEDCCYCCCCCYYYYYFFNRS